MSRLMVTRIRLFLILTAISAAGGAIEVWSRHIGHDHPVQTLILVGAANWCIGGSLVWAFELFFVPGRYGTFIRELHFVAAILIKTLVVLAIVLATTIFGRAVFEGVTDLSFFRSPEYYKTVATVFIALFIIQTIVQIVRIIGGRTLIYFVLGRYRKPVQEDRIFMFLDLAGSTTLARELGDIGVQSMITRFFLDIAEPIAEYQGETHRYVGDQIVVTWPLKDPVSNARAINCCFAIADRVEQLAPRYQKIFGTTPRFRIGLHGGPVVVSQCGDNKQEISYFGDTVNTAARIEQQCKEFDCSLLVSGELMNQVGLPEGFTSRAIGQTQLRGRDEPTELFTVDRD